MKEMRFSLPLISNFRSRREWEMACWEKIVKSEDLLKLFITSYERHHIITRIAAMNYLEQGKNFQQIVEELQLSPQTVSSIKKAIKNNTYVSYWEGNKAERKKRVYKPKIKRREKDHYNKPTSLRKSKKKSYYGGSFRTKYGIVHY